MNVRRDKLLRRIDPTKHRGLEIGALDRPTLSREEAQVRYVDYASSEELRRQHAGSGTVDASRIVEVDHVWGEKSLRDEIGGDERFDFVVASHVVEHVPDLVTWLQELAEVLRPGGVVSLIVPDRRYTFDRLRRNTAMGDLVQAHLERRRKPSIQQIFDHYADHVQVDPQQAWNGLIDDARIQRVHDERQALEICRGAVQSGRYVDAHCWVFTPASFIELLRGLAEMQLLDFTLCDFWSTERGEIDFFVGLERLPEEMPHPERLALQHASFDRAAASLLGAPEPSVPAPAEEPQVPSISRLFGPEGVEAARALLLAAGRKLERRARETISARVRSGRRP